MVEGHDCLGVCHERCDLGDFLIPWGEVRENGPVHTVGDPHLQCLPGRRVHLLLSIGLHAVLQRGFMNQHPCRLCIVLQVYAGYCVT